VGNLLPLQAGKIFAEQALADGLSRNLEPGIPPGDPQHPKDFSPRERSDERGEMSQRSVGGTPT